MTGKNVPFLIRSRSAIPIEHRRAGFLGIGGRGEVIFEMAFFVGAARNPAVGRVSAAPAKILVRSWLNCVGLGGKLELFVQHGPKVRYAARVNCEIFPLLA
jgi:hypothetical protein